MKAYEIMDELFEMASEGDYTDTCDTCKAGDPEIEVTKVAVTMFATVDVVRAAKEWGAELLITHEPTYYNDRDVHSDEKIECEKRRLIEDARVTLYRFHDHPHFTVPDIIVAGELREMGLAGNVEHAGSDLARIHLEQTMTAVELARFLEERLKIKHMRICGACHIPSNKVSFMFGAPYGVFEELKSEQCEILFTGEACEWALGEYARDAAQLGYNKTLIIMGHAGSERAGMKYTVDILKNKHPELEVKYFECGEVYSYTDDDEKMADI